ncbi:MAG: hypothetical protein B5M53_00275 [Candidatus Cloacimonas sp. 4484_209]|nr:MAG: hypothetical protein B5M53_00275 [Candidatus Cloacimonas sp. 4484_209]
MKIKNILRKLPQGTDYFIVTNLKNVRFITGFTGDWAIVLLSKRKNYFITDARFTEQAQKEVEGFHIIIIKKNFMENLKSLIKPPKTIAFEADNLRYESFINLKKTLKGCKFIPTSGIISEFRMIKTAEEIKKIARAARIADRSFSEILPYIRVGVREIEIAAEFEYILRKNGSSGHPFSTIAITSTNTSLPHGQPGMRKIKKGDLFLLDFGATYKGYVSDMTRTVVVGKATKKQKEIYSIVLKAQTTAIESVKIGLKLSDLDKIARDIIKDAGYEKNFGHSLGHGIGLEVHEEPLVSFRSKKKVQKGMVFTVEPGIYIPRWGGVRIEDDIAVIDNTSIKILTKSPKKELIEL